MLSILLRLIAAICFAASLLVDLGAVSSNGPAWLAGGLLAWVIATLVAGVVVNRQPVA